MSTFNNIGKKIKDRGDSPLQEVKNTQIPTLKRVGKGRPKKPYSKPKLLRLNTITIKLLDEFSKKEGVSPSQLFEKIFKEYINNIK